VARDLFDLVGTTIAGKFQVERVLGEGGFGVVYAGLHVMLGERVAIKCLKPVGTTDEDRERGAQQFLREARILFGLGHPAIVRLYDVGVIEQRQIPYVVLELLTGTTLEAEIASRAATRRHFGRDELFTVLGPILEAVAFAHERGIVHRDLKPSNMMLVSEAGRLLPKVLDFGTARADVAGTGRAGAPSPAAPEGSLGKTGFTPLYAAPEQWDAQFGTTGPRTDVFALGLTIAEVCLLGYPIDSASGGILAVFKASLDESARPMLARTRPDLPPELEQVILRAMRARPDERYADARELSSAFRAALRVAPSTAPLAPPLSPSYSPPQAAHPSYGPPQAAYAPSYGPPQAGALVGSSTTQPHAVGATGPAIAPSRSNVIPWVIGIAGLGIAVVMVVIGVVVAVVLPSASPTPAPPANAPAAPAAPTAAPTAPTVKPGSTVASGPAPRLILGSAIGMAPFWTQAEVMDVARTHHNEMIGCAREAVVAQPGVEGDISITVHPNKSGTVESVQCSMRVHNTAGETALCGCVEATMGRWKYPAAHGRLGFLDSAPFIYGYKLFPP
jgi:eukaryotic-like serine/threonine-protein kinase